MVKIGLHFFLLCHIFYDTAARHPDATGECLGLFERLYMSGVSEIKHWDYEIMENARVKCTGFLKYNTPRVLKLGCHTTISKPVITLFEPGVDFYDGEKYVMSQNNDIYLDLVINRNNNQYNIICSYYNNFKDKAAIVVELVYEPFETLPVKNRPNLANAIMYKIKTNDSGDVCDTSTNITVKEGPLMVKISGNYDRVDHFWCQNYNEEGKNSEEFLKRDDFSEYKNPNEIVTVIDTINVGENHMRWNCTLLTWKGGTEIHQNNLYYYEKAYYSKITWTGFIHIVGAENNENELIINLDYYKNDISCVVEPSQNLTINEGNTLTVKVLNSNQDFKFWCEKFDKNTQSNNKPKVLEAVLDNEFLSKFRNYAIAVILIKSLHGEFDCFLADYNYDPTFNRFYSTHIYYHSIRPKMCHTRLNIIRSARYRSDSNYKTTTPQTAMTTSVKPKMATSTTPKVTLQAMSKPTSTDAPKDLPAVWMYVSVGLAVVIVVLGVAFLIYCLHMRRRGRNTATPDIEHN